MTKKFFLLGIALLFLLVTASYICAAGVDLAWDPPDPESGGPVEGYYLFWKATGGSYSDANRMDVSGTSATVSGLDEAMEYNFIVKAYNGGGANIGPASNEIAWSYSDNTPPLPPEGVSAQ